MHRPFLLLATGFLLASQACSAKVLLPSVFSDHMVLERSTTVAVWGWSDPGEHIRVTGSWSSADTIRTIATNDGHWRVDLPTGAAGGPYTLSVIGAYTNQIINDVQLGEVWICSGQSNMEFTASWGLEHRDSLMAQADFPGIRFFHIPRVGAAYPQQDCRASWEICTPSTMAANTAVGYFFARELFQTLNVPVGIIEAAWGGTPAEVWTRADRVAANPALVANEYDDHNIGWPVTPGVLYNGMIAPVIPYGVAGALWYQGEANTYRPWTYSILMDSLVTGWRRDFGRDFPFYYVQIAPFAYDPTHQKAFVLREQQDMDQKLIPHSGMVVIADLVPNINDIHPKNKLDVGKRLAAYALADTYHRPSTLPYQSPAYQSMRVEKNKVFLNFVHAEAGLVAVDPTPGSPAATPGPPAAKGAIPNFQIAGADQHFVDAIVEIRGSALIVSSPAVPSPVAVRYCFSNSAVPTVFSKDARLPIAPFRTDHWKIDE